MSSNVKEVDKREIYSRLNTQLSAILDDTTDLIANLANASALLYEVLPSINWSGFYLFKNNELVLGPFQGKVACTRIPLGKGVCGKAAEDRKTYLVEDVHKFPSHIACDPTSRSEIVIPLIKNDLLIGVLDIDSPYTARFSAEDQRGLEVFVQILLNRI